MGPHAKLSPFIRCQIEPYNEQPLWPVHIIECSARSRHGLKMPFCAAAFPTIEPQQNDHSPRDTTSRALSITLHECEGIPKIMRITYFILFFLLPFNVLSDWHNGRLAFLIMCKIKKTHFIHVPMLCNSYIGCLWAVVLASTLATLAVMNVQLQSRPHLVKQISRNHSDFKTYMCLIYVFPCS